MALLCCFLLIVEKIPIVECERLYELTWSWRNQRAVNGRLASEAQRGSGRRPGAPRQPLETPPAGEDRGEGLRAFGNEKAYFELAGPPRAARWVLRGEPGRPSGEAAGGRRGLGAPLRSQPGPQAAGPGRGLEPPWLGRGVGGGSWWIGSGALSQFSGRVERGLRPVRPRLPKAQKCRAGGPERLQTERSPKEGSRPLPAPRRLLFKAFFPPSLSLLLPFFLTRGLSLSSPHPPTRNLKWTQKTGK